MSLVDGEVRGVQIMSVDLSSVVRRDPITEGRMQFEVKSIWTMVVVGLEITFSEVFPPDSPCRI